jgi:hypothetical protein
MSVRDVFKTIKRTFDIRDNFQRYLAYSYPKASYFVIIGFGEWSQRGIFFECHAPNSPYIRDHVVQLCPPDSPCITEYLEIILTLSYIVLVTLNPVCAKFHT